MAATLACNICIVPSSNSVVQTNWAIVCPISIVQHPTIVYISEENFHVLLVSLSFVAVRVQLLSSLRIKRIYQYMHIENCWVSSSVFHY